jgi:ADP-ribose pyrophosphatase YjhB (NUDIX family)
MVGALSSDGIDWLTVLDELQAIAKTGLAYSTDPYDRERCNRLLDLATRGYAASLSLPEPEVRARLARELGYVTAKVGADAAIFDESGRVLLVHRSDTLTWGLISGFVDPGETPTTTLVREVREEVGLTVSDYELIDVLGRPAGTEFGPHAVVSVLYLCAVTPGPVTISHEAVAAGFREIDDVVGWHANHERLARIAHAAWLARRAD